MLVLGVNESEHFRFLIILEVAVEGHVEDLIVFMLDFVELFLELGVLFVLEDDVYVFVVGGLDN